jgi:hypothetical protein
MAPKDLQKTRKEYQEFSLEVFRKHIHQEVRLKKYVAQYRDLGDVKNPPPQNQR